MKQFPGCRQAFSTIPAKTVKTGYPGNPSPGFGLPRWWSLTVGRSLREVEKRESQVEQITGMVWLVTLAVVLVIVAGCELIFAK